MANPNLPINAQYNTYVGARYVPVFANPTEWNINMQYEPLTIVTYQGNSFTSKTFVPKGVDINNTVYWANTGNYNGQIESYRQEVINLDNELQEFKQLNDLWSRKFLFIGDSYNTSIHGGGWGKAAIAKLGLTKGVNAFSYGVGGAGFGTIGGEYGTYHDIMVNAATQMGDTVNATITDVVVGGSINDYSRSGTDINRGLIDCYNYVRSTWPNAKYWILCQGWGASQPDMPHKALAAYNTYVQSGMYAAVIKDAWRTIALPLAYKSDMVHPADSYITLLGYSVANIVLGGTVYQRFVDKISCSFGDIQFMGSTSQYGVNVECYSYAGINLDTPITIPGGISGDGVKVIDGSNNQIFMYRCQFTADALIRHGTPTVYDTVPVTVTINTTKGVPSLYLKSKKFYNPAIGSNGWEIPDVTGIYLNFNTFIAYENL